MSDKVTAMDLRNRAGELLSRALYAGERFIVERKGKPVAALISLEDLKLLEHLEEERDAALLRLAEQSSRGLVPFEELVKQYERLFGKRLKLPSKKARKC